jgi:hypothetical protein
MDGFKRESKVILLAATNRPDTLDPALLRPGRFDRRIVTDIPDIKGREEILKIHNKNKPLEKQVDLEEIAKRTAGFSGADLENVANEAAILATRRHKKNISQEDLMESIEKVLLGPERKSHILNKEEKKITAYHEAGHALVSAFLPDAETVRKVSIVARGVSAYSVAIFHLMTHAFFKALLFLAAGSVIVALHHEQDIRKMGGLKKYLPITYWTGLIGSLALIGFPGFSGFFSKDAIIEAVHASTLPGSGFAYFAVMSGIFITALYSFRLFFIVFHGEERFEKHDGHLPHESPAVVTWPLILLAIPSVLAGFFIGPMVFGDFFGEAIFVLDNHDVLSQLHYHGVFSFLLHGVMALPFWLAMAGVATAYYFYLVNPSIPAKLHHSLNWLYRVLENKYGFDRFNEIVFAGGARLIGRVFWKVGDQTLIDGTMVNGTAKMVGFVSKKVRHVQSGYLYHYAFAMILGVWLLLTFFVA